MSPNSAGLAAKWGHKNPLVYLEGIPAWKKAGNRILPSIDYVADGNIVLVDLRKTAEVTKGYIPRAYSIPFDELEDADYSFPKSLSAPIYLYSDKDAEVDAARKIVAEWGFRNVVGFHGALDAWKGAGKKLQTGPALTATDDMPINWQKKLGPGEISITDFTKSLNSDLIRVIDARTPAEYESGHFPGSVSIPLEQMKARMSEIPKDKFIVVHCTTGGRGEIGYRMLKEEGYSVKFLNAECLCTPTGSFEIW